MIQRYFNMIDIGTGKCKKKVFMKYCAEAHTEQKEIYHAMDLTMSVVPHPCSLSATALIVI